MQHGPGLHMGSMDKKLATFEVTFKGKRQIADRTYEYSFEKPEDLKFRAGQHIRMTLINPPETDAEGDKRFFTMASTPQDSDLVFAWRVRDTAFKRVVQRMQPGDKVIIQKLLGEAPEGSFVLHGDATRPAVFIAGGIGIVPAYAMIKDVLQRGLKHEMYLFYSNRRPEDAPYLSELQTLSKKNPRLTVIATMTEADKSNQAWNGETGHIDKTMLTKYVSDSATPVYYVSGLPDMVTAMQKLLSDMGISKNSIRAEEFAGFKMGEGAHSPAASAKRHLMIGAVIVAVVLIVAIHAGGISHANLTKLSLSNPLSYLIMAAILAVLVFKVSMILKLKRLIHAKQDGERLTANDILDAHKPTGKR